MELRAWRHGHRQGSHQPALDRRDAIANLSADKGNAYFAEGFQDEILARLSKTAQLKVILRTSTVRYASSPENLPEIARELGPTMPTRSP